MQQQYRNTHKSAQDTPKIWKVELRKIIDANKTKHAVKDKMVSTATKQARHEILYQFFTQLREIGYKLDDPRNLKEKHFKAILQKWLDEGLAAATIQKRTSIVRTFCTWIGKPNMIGNLELYVEDKARVQRSQIATTDKSWSTNGINFEEVIKTIDAYDIRAGAQLRMIRAFGLRREEAVCFRPIVAMRLGEASQSITVEFGTKGGRPRAVAIDSDMKRQALDYACKIAGTTNGHIGWENLTLKQAVQRYANIMQKFQITKKGLGVTGHGLRHEYANNELEKLTGIPSPVRGGDNSQLDKDEEYLAKMKVTKELGHGRTSVTQSYFGSYNTKQQAPELTTQENP